MAFSFGFIVYVSFLHPGVEMKEIKDPTETLEDSQTLAQNQKVKLNAQEKKEPWISTENLIRHGNSVFQQNCAVCHGKGGAGDGPASAGINPRNFIKGNWKQGRHLQTAFHNYSKRSEGHFYGRLSSLN